MGSLRIFIACHLPNGINIHSTDISFRCYCSSAPEQRVPVPLRIHEARLQCQVARSAWRQESPSLVPRGARMRESGGKDPAVCRTSVSVPRFSAAVCASKNREIGQRRQYARFLCKPCRVAGLCGLSHPCAAFGAAWSFAFCDPGWFSQPPCW